MKKEKDVNVTLLYNKHNKLYTSSLTLVHVHSINSNSSIPHVVTSNTDNRFNHYLYIGNKLVNYRDVFKCNRITLGTPNLRGVFRTCF